jgi:hypothetical protein
MTRSDTSSVPPIRTSARCPRCGRSFDCGRRGDPSQPFDCWCLSMPPLPPGRLAPGMRCLCPECLAEALAAAPPHPPSG